MRKICKQACILGAALLLFVFGSLLCEKRMLQENLIRLHIVANSNKASDQRDKMLVKEEIAQYLRLYMQNMESKEDALRFLEKELPNIQALAGSVLQKAGAAYEVRVHLSREAFGLRSYDTFSLPSGMYDALRIELGEAQGDNWWCVVFPDLCEPATTGEFTTLAVRSGLDSALIKTLTGVYEIRFQLLDWLGKIENFFFG